MKRVIKALCTVVLFSNAAPTGVAQAHRTNSVADRLAIQDVIARYSFAWDSDDADAFAELFTEDAVWEMYELKGDKPIWRYESQESIRAFAAERKTRLPGVKSGHHQSGLVNLEISDNAAQSRNMLINTQQREDESSPRVVASRVYYDTWRKTPDGWRIAHRVLRLDGPFPDAE